MPGPFRGPGRSFPPMLAAALEPLDIARVAPRLYIGSAPPVGPALRDAGFDVVVLCAEEYQPRSWELPGVHVIHAPFDDSATPTDADVTAARGAARLTARAVAAKKRVLVSCWQGRNRSGLVCAEALKLLYRWDPRVCIGAIQAVRPHALTNGAFRELIQSL